MKLSGHHVVKAPPSAVWDLLMDPEVLARITPGLDKLEMVSPDRYDSVADVKIGPVKGSFRGTVEVTNKREGESFTLVVKQSSKIGSAKAEIDMLLKALTDDRTEFSFDGDAKLSGLIARTGQRVVSGVASMLTKQFFSALDEVVDE